MEIIDLKSVETIKAEDKLKYYKYDFLNEIQTINSKNIKLEDTNETVSNIHQDLHKNITANFGQVLTKDIKTEIDIEDDRLSEASIHIKTEESDYETEYEGKSDEENVSVTTPDLNVTEMESESAGCLFYKTEEQNQKKTSTNKISNIQVCDIDNTKVKNISHMRTHKKNSHECRICQKKFTKASLLTYHTRIHTGENPYECNVCKRKFSKLISLTRHLRIHSGEKPFKCGICNKAFAQSTNLTLHVRIHSGEKPYECKFCKKTYSRSGNLTTHLRIHTGEKPFECGFCEKKFVQRNILTNHMRIHTGEKPYECNICKKAFRQSTNLKNHMIMHSGEKPYECDICKKKFNILANLTRHMKIHTKKTHL